MPSDTAAPNPGPNQPKAGSGEIPPNGPDYGSAPPFTQPAPPWGMPPFSGMPPFGGMPYGASYGGYGMPPFAMPGYSGPGFPGPGFPNMDAMMSQMMDRAAFMHRFMITMSNMAAEMSRACQLLAQHPSHIGMPFPPATAAAPSGTAASPADKPVDMEALRQALAGMDPVQAQKTLYAVQMMQWCASMMRGGQQSGSAPAGEPTAQSW